MIPFIWNVQNNQNHREKVVARAWGRGERGTFAGEYGVFEGVMSMFWSSIVVVSLKYFSETTYSNIYCNSQVGNIICSVT